MRRQLLPTTQLQTWAQFFGARFLNARVVNSMKTPDGADKGAGLVATRTVESEQTDRILLVVPNDLVLSKERVEQLAKADVRLREVLVSLGNSVQSPRMAILVCLLLQITHSSPEPDMRIGVNNPFTDYVKFLPEDFTLSTFYSEDERDLLLGTSLQDATSQKLVSLQKEFDHLRDSTKDINWCQQQWWDEESGHLTFDDWRLVDAMYRSRALELPRVGDSMVPLVDMANHAPVDCHNARFEVDEECNIMLVLRDGKSIEVGEEITIQYGAAGACEMVFSYGFLDDGTNNAREIFLNLDMPLDDPLGLAKKSTTKEMPGVRFYTDMEGQAQWESSYVYWISVNEEDGLDFQIVQENNGDRELRVLWKGQDLDAQDLPGALRSDSRHDIFRLRSVVILQDRLEEQARTLTASDELTSDSSSAGQVRPGVLTTIHKLSQLERELLGSAYDALETEKEQLTASHVVQYYLRHTDAPRTDEGPPQEDYS